MGGVEGAIEYKDSPSNAWSLSRSTSAISSHSNEKAKKLSEECKGVAIRNPVSSAGFNAEGGPLVAARGRFPISLAGIDLQETGKRDREPSHGPAHLCPYP